MRVDLRSDTVTQPTSGMRQAMMDAPLGDDVLGDDPTVNRLQAVAAERSGKEAALFVPSGTMANLVALCVQTRPGDEILLEQGAHPFHYEAGGGAAIAGAQFRLLPGVRGVLDPASVVAALRPDDPHFAPAVLLCLEDTSNRGGGTVYPLERIDALGAAAHDHGLSMHIDGARSMNAVVASGIPLARRTAAADTVSFCFSKGLGAPAGSVICGPKDLIHRGLRVRKMLGGAMRQAGVLAGAALYALQHHVQRLADDHARAAALAEELIACGLDPDTPQTNIVYAEVPRAPELQTRLEAEGVLLLALGPTRVRIVTHLDVDDAGIAHAREVFRRVVPEHLGGN